jgi:methionine-gamma-lyase
VTAGIAVAADAELAGRIRLCGLKDMTGAVLSPQDASLVLRGLKTLSLRMERHCANAAAIADLLASHPEVERVYYPGLPNDPQHTLARRQMSAFGGMLAFELKGGLDAGRRFLDALQLVTRAVSLGDAETLVQHPATMTHSTYTAEERAAALISDGLVRLSAGLEEIDDLLADLAQALDAAAGQDGRELTRHAA